jgi:hypothetical protein
VKVNRVDLADLESVEELRREISAMTSGEMAELIREISRQNFSVLDAAAGIFSGQPIVELTIGLMSFVECGSSRMPPAVRLLLATVLRKEAESLERGSARDQAHN